jgi:hypothetical protein
LRIKEQETRLILHKRDDVDDDDNDREMSGLRKDAEIRSAQNRMAGRQSET